MSDSQLEPPVPVKQSRLGVALKMLASLTVTAVMLECTIRTVHVFRPLNFVHTNSYDRFRAKPHAQDWNFTLNSRGFKDLEFGPKQAGKFRITALGDSFAYGVVPYDSNYLTLLEEGLRQHLGDVEVLNMGIPALGPGEYLDIFTLEALPLEPDLVLLSFFIGNDFSETRRQRRWYKRSTVMMFLRYLYVIGTQYEGRVIHDPGEYCDTCPAFTEDAYLKLEKRRSAIYLVQDPTLDGLIDDAVSNLTRIRDACREKGIPFLVVLIPDELQVSESLRDAVIERFYPSLREGEWDTTKPNRALAARLAEERIDFKDLLVDLQRAAQGEPVYRPRDTHWNRAGNRVAASVLEPWVRSEIRESP